MLVEIVGKRYEEKLLTTSRKNRRIFRKRAQGSNKGN